MCSYDNFLNGLGFTAEDDAILPALSPSDSLFTISSQYGW